MIQALRTILAALSTFAAVGALIVAYVIWRGNCRIKDAAAEAAAAANPGIWGDK